MWFQRVCSRELVVTFGAMLCCTALSTSAQEPMQAEQVVGAVQAESSQLRDDNAVAMSKMMAAMNVASTGDVDHDFVAMMVPHHQGAIDMAMIILRYSNNEQIRRLAQEIIVTQQQEIAAMRLAVGEPLPPSAPAPTAARVQMWTRGDHQ